MFRSIFSTLISKLAMLIPTYVGISIIAFGLIRLIPGDPALLMLGERGGSPEVVAQIQKDLGLDRPIWEQYGIFVSRALQGDLGTSIVSKQPVLGEFKSRFPATFELALVSISIATLLGIPLGLIAATRRNRWPDYTVMGASLVGYSMPIFWWGLLLILFFSVYLGWTPVSGRIAIEYDITSVTGFLLLDCWLQSGASFSERAAAFTSAIHHLALPAIALSTIPLATIARMTRSSVLETLGEDYIRTARSRGLSPQRVLWVHAFRNALVPIITVIGIIFGALVTGAILTETIFSWPGIGKWLVNSVTSRDYPVIQGGILLIASIIIVVNLCVDLIYAWANPRMRGKL